MEVPASSSPSFDAVFSWHRTGHQDGASFLANYTITDVLTVSDSVLVLAATHVNLSSVELAIKIVANADDALEEQKIHHLLTQLDAAKTREMAAKKAAKSRDAAQMFEANPADAAGFEAALEQSYQDPQIYTVVPLYDFANQQERLVDVLASAPHYDIWKTRNVPLGMLVMRRTSGSLESLLKNKSVSEKVGILLSVMRQICAQLYALAPMKFTHGDVHAGNVGYFSNGTGSKPRYYQLNTGEYVTIDRDQPQIVLYDYGYSTLDTKDATGTEFRIGPSRAQLSGRFPPPFNVPSQLYSPMIDAFRLTQLLLHQMALAVTLESDILSWIFIGSTIRDVNQLANGCLTVLRRIGVNYNSNETYRALKKFAESLSMSTLVLAKIERRAKAVAEKLSDPRVRNSLWPLVYMDAWEKSTGQTLFREMLEASGSISKAAPSGTNVTMPAIIGKGRIVYGKPHG
jgi:hypothetical protein